MGRRADKWYSGVAATSAELVVGDETHRIIWRRGALVLDDHPDPAADAALAALGAPRCLCLDVLDAWRHERDRLLITETTEPVRWRAHLRRLLDLRDRHQDMLGRFTNAHPMVPIGIRLRLYAEIGAPVGSTDPEVYERFADRLTDEFNSEVLRSIPQPLFDILIASLAVHAERIAIRGATDTDTGSGGVARAERWSILDATSHRVRRSVEQWLGPSTPGTIGVRLEEGEPSCAINDLFDTSGGSLDFVLPTGWLVDVWSRGLAVADDRFVLAADAIHAGDRITVTVCELHEDRAGLQPRISKALAHRVGTDRWALSPPPSPDRPAPRR